LHVAAIGELPSLQARTRLASARASLLDLEILQVRRRLILARRHQIAVAAHEVVLLADEDLLIALGAIEFVPAGLSLGLAKVFLGDDPRPSQSVIDDGDLVMQRIRVGLVEGSAILDLRK
jgi:hypothetical protein